MTLSLRGVANPPSGHHQSSRSQCRRCCRLGAIDLEFRSIKIGSMRISLLHELERQDDMAMIDGRIHRDCA